MTDKFMCPHCKKEIDRNLISKFFAMIGGKAGKRKLSSEDAKAMSELRWKKKG